MIRLALAAALLASCWPAQAREPAGLNAALQQLAKKGQFSGAVVIRGSEGVRFAQGYGLADPFTGRPFTTRTPADSGSLAKPVTAAAVLALVQEGKLALDAPVKNHLPEYPHAATTVRDLLSHSAGLPESAIADITGKTNADLLAAVSRPDVKPLFAPGTGFSYCNLCFSTLALLIERTTARSYLDVVREKAALPVSVRLRPARLADWTGRAIGYRREPDGKIVRADSYENELFYGTANLSISADELALWGSRWWSRPLLSLRPAATMPARIGDRSSGLTLGNWYCAPTGLRCHYLGHHEGFHHMLYWDGQRRLSIAMVSNNTLAPAFQQRLQRAIVAFAEGRASDARREIARPLPAIQTKAGRYRLRSGEIVSVTGDGPVQQVQRAGLSYGAYAIGSGVRYVPGLDVYISGAPKGSLRWLSLYEDLVGVR